MSNTFETAIECAAPSRTNAACATLKVESESVFLSQRESLANSTEVEGLLSSTGVSFIQIRVPKNVFSRSCYESMDELPSPGCKGTEAREQVGGFVSLELFLEY